MARDGSATGNCCINNTKRRGSLVRADIAERGPTACVHIRRDETATEVDIVRPQISKVDRVYRVESTLIKLHLRQPRISGAAPSHRDKPQAKSMAAVHRDEPATKIKVLRPQAPKAGVDFDEVATSVELRRHMPETAEKDPPWDALTAGRRVVFHAHDLKCTRHPGLNLAKTVIWTGTPTDHGDLAVPTEETAEIDDMLFSCWSMEHQDEVPSWDLAPLRRTKAMWRRILVMGLSFLSVMSLAAALYGIVAYA